MLLQGMVQSGLNFDKLHGEMAGDEYRLKSYCLNLVL